MKVFSEHEFVAVYCKAAHKWAIWFGLPHDVPPLEARRAAPWLPPGTLPGSGVAVFDTQQAAEEAFWATVGDDGPTKTNPYSGPAKVYACLVGPDGLMSENT